MKRLKLLFAVALALVLLSGSVVLFHLVSPREKTDLDYIRLFSSVMAIVKERYVDPVDDKKLLQGAVNGMLASLDPHSAYLPPEPFKEMQVSTSGAFGGLGIEITISDGKLTVISPIEDTPAYRAGIKAGDHIFKIDGKLTADLNINQAVKLMRGEKGTSVTLTISRKDFPLPRPFTITRDIILVKSVRGRMIESGIGYVRITQFQERTGKDLAEQLARLHAENGGTMKGLVLDLRNNPGGLLDQAVRVAEQFIGNRLSNGLIVFTRGRTDSSRRDMNASVGDKQPPYPMIVLINGGSASASEIVAGALQDHGRAVIMGTQSFGKGSVQSVIPLKHDAALLLTTARYYTPSGRSIQARGITPDIIVNSAEITLNRKETDLELREKDLDNHIEGAPAPGPSVAPVTARPGKTADTTAKKDYQLVRAVDLLKGWSVLNKLTGPPGDR